MTTHRRNLTPLPWDLLAEETLGRYRLFSLLSTRRRSRHSGREQAFVRLIAPDWINVMALNSDGQMLLVEQYRHGTDAVTIEIPGGMVDNGEEPAQAAARELEEETGYRAGSLFLLGRVEPNPAFLNNSCWTFLALDCELTDGAQPDPCEEIRLVQSSLAGFFELIDSGAIRHALVIAAHDHLQRALKRNEPCIRPLLAWL